MHCKESGWNIPAEVLVACDGVGSTLERIQYTTCRRYAGGHQYSFLVFGRAYLLGDELLDSRLQFHG